MDISSHLIELRQCYGRLTPEKRHELVARIAYAFAEQRGFAPGHEDEDWARAEAVIRQSCEGDAYSGD